MIGAMQTVSVIGQVATRSGWVDYVSLVVGILVGIGTVTVAAAAYYTTRKSRQWQRELSQPFPVVTDLTVRRIIDAEAADGEVIKDGYSSSAYVYNAGEAPLLIRYARLFYLYLPDGGEAALVSSRHFKADPLLIRGGAGSKITFCTEKDPTRFPSEWPTSVSLSFEYYSGRTIGLYLRTWDLLEGRDDSSPTERMADMNRLTLKKSLKRTR